MKTLLIYYLFIILFIADYGTAIALDPAYKDTVTGMEFVFVKGGCYQMGDIFDNWQKDEKPVHEVCIDGFYMGKYEVTQGQWIKIMGSNPSWFRDCGDKCPVENVSWNDVMSFIDKLNRQADGKYRLPTEAEWEYACRSGGKNEKFSGSNIIDNVAWYSENSHHKTNKAGLKYSNGLGIYDMSGNVWEWVEDWYEVSAYRSLARNNPINNTAGDFKVFRGGSWNYYPIDIRCATRYSNIPDYHSSDIGFRLIMVP